MIGREIKCMTNQAGWQACKLASQDKSSRVISLNSKSSREMGDWSAARVNNSASWCVVSLATNQASPQNVQAHDPGIITVYEE